MSGTPVPNKTSEIFEVLQHLANREGLRVGIDSRLGWLRVVLYARGRSIDGTIRPRVEHAGFLGPIGAPLAYQALTLVRQHNSWGRTPTEGADQ